MTFRWDILWRSLPVLWEGTKLTVQLTASAVAIGLVIGTFMGMGRLSQYRIIRSLTGAYVDFFRGTPLLVQIFLVYMGLPQLLGFPMPRFTAALIALSLNSGAYVAEIVRAGIQSVDPGQREAALSLGMSNRQVMQYIILPQAFKRIIPPLGNEFIAMLKDSSLVSVIALEELVRKANIIVTRTYRPFEIWIGVAFIYLIMTLTISRFVAYTEKRFNTDV
ncbi:MAG: amino acid ABC transporter permease [Limnochordia bacterium]